VRRHKLKRDDVLAIVESANRVGEDKEGNPMYASQVRGTFYRAVVALDDGSLITIYDVKR
jgi:hypothetical protein